VTSCTTDGMVSMELQTHKICQQLGTHTFLSGEEERRGQDGWFWGRQGGEQAYTNTVFLFISVLKPCSFLTCAASISNFVLGLG
jgi:hypothetical protein